MNSDTGRTRRGFLQGTLAAAAGLGMLETVARAARAAAYEDGRFEPVSAAELADLQIEISVLSPLRRVQAEEIEVGRHGLLLRCQGRQGLLLPQVATEHGWDRLVFLDQTCRKAGLAPGAWRQPGAEIWAFSAVVFGENPVDE